MKSDITKDNIFIEIGFSFRNHHESLICGDTFLYKKFKEEFLQKPEIAMFFIKSLTKKIKFLENFINYNITLNSMEKIAKFLIENEDLLPTLKQVKIAQILNITPETFSRQLAKLKKDEIIQNEKGFIKILDYSSLKKLISSM